jgi:hypothetical protein
MKTVAQLDNLLIVRTYKEVHQLRVQDCWYVEKHNIR